MWPLLALSLLSLTVTIERIYFWYKENSRSNDQLANELLTHVKEGRITDALKAGKGTDDGCIQAIMDGLKYRDDGFDKIVQIAADKEIGKMKQGLGVLDTIVTLAPLLGILGTVLGIIHSFDMLGKSGIENPSAVTGGIAQALITTATGLTIAIVTLIPFNYFISKTEAATKRMEMLGTSFDLALHHNLGGANEA